MEKIFRPNKWFVIFCALFIGVWTCLNYVIDSRIKEIASVLGEDMFSWKWPSKDPTGFDSLGSVTSASILKRGPNDARVAVKGKQIFDKAGVKTESDFEAVLTLYKDKNDWKVGKVEVP